MRNFDKAAVVDEELHDLKLRFELLGRLLGYVDVGCRGRQESLL